MASCDNGSDGNGRAWRWKALPLFGSLQGGLSRAGYVKLFALGLAIGIGLGVVGGRFAERLRLADYAAIEQMILDREHPPLPARPGPPRLLSPSEPSQM
jgi:hypothetical protein